MEDSTLAQSKLSQFEDPAFEAAEVKEQLRPLSALIEKLMKKPKPIPPVVVKTVNDTVNGTDAAESSTVEEVLGSGEKQQRGDDDNDIEMKEEKIVDDTLNAGSDKDDL